MMNIPELSIIILNHNTKELTLNCLQSIFNNLPEKLFEVIVVDNASSDGSLESLKKNYKQIKLVISDKNLGFAKGVNKGVQKATGNYLLFLNSDTILEDQSILKMLEFSKFKNVGIVGGVMRNFDGSVQRSYGKFYSLFIALKILIGGDRVEMNRSESSSPHKTDWVSGGFMLVKRSIYEQLNGFDEGFFMYMEDMEFCYRANEAGIKIYFFPDSHIIHFNQGSSNRSFAIENIYKGLLYFFRKHKSYPEYVILKIVLWAKAIVLIISGIILKNSYLKKTYSKAIGL